MFSKLVVLFLLVTVAFAAPAEDADTDLEIEERGVLDVDANFWDALLTGKDGGAVAVIGAVFATALLAGGAGLAFYYFYYLKYSGYAVADYSASAVDVYSNQQYPYGTTYPGYQHYATAARSLDTGTNWNWPQVLFMISLAQDTFEKFDFQSLDCQKKALCELSQKQTDFGETGRRISNTFSYAARRFLGVVEGIPMPTIILTYLKEYREAINQGRTAKKECASIYPTCTFSMKEVIVKYEKRAASMGEKS